MPSGFGATPVSSSSRLPRTTYARPRHASSSTTSSSNERTASSGASASKSKHKRARLSPPPSDDSAEETDEVALYARGILDHLEELIQKDEEEKRKEKKAAGVFVPAALPIEYEGFDTEGKLRESAIWVKAERNLWPARLIAFRPAQSAEGKDVWEVEIHPAAKVDPAVFEVHKDRVYWRKDPSTAKRPIGGYQSWDVVDPSDARTRSPTPPPASDTAADITGPIDPAIFDDLPSQQQLFFMRSHLQKIISEDYAPAQWRNNGFYIRHNRQKLEKKKEAGDIRENQLVQVVLPELARWLLRGERWEVEIKPEDAPSDEIAPPSGSERFNALSSADKADYLDRVLRTEALIQLQIRREGIAHLAQIELDRRRRDDPDAPKPSIRPDNIPPLAVGKEPQSAIALPDQYLKAIATNRTKANDIPEWVSYSLALSHLQTLGKRDAVIEWRTIEMELKRCRRNLRTQQGLPDENESKEEKNLRQLKEQKKRPHFTGERITNPSEYAEFFK